MDEYIMGLGISVKICKIYEELIYLMIKEEHNTDDFLNLIIELKKLLVKEKEVYDKLDYNKLLFYFDKVSNSNNNDLDNIKNRYYSQLKERVFIKDNTINIFNGDKYTENSISLDTCIMGKLLIEALKKVNENITNDMSFSNNNFFISFLLNSQEVYKYRLISSNPFLEKIAINYNFEINKLPNISFDMLKKMFDCNDTFDLYLNKALLPIGEHLVSELLDNDNLVIDDVYSSLLNVALFEIVVSYLNIENLRKLIIFYRNNLDIDNNNDLYIKKILKKRLFEFKNR